MSIKKNLRCEWFDCSPLTASFDYLCSRNWINLFLLALFGTGGSWSRRPSGGSRTHGWWCKEATVVPQVTVGLIDLRVCERKWCHLKVLFFFLVILGAKRTNWIPRKYGRKGRQSQWNQTHLQTFNDVQILHQHHDVTVCFQGPPGFNGVPGPTGPPGAPVSSFSSLLFTWIKVPSYTNE